MAWTSITKLHFCTSIRIQKLKNISIKKQKSTLEKYCCDFFNKLTFKHRRPIRLQEKWIRKMNKKKIPSLDSKQKYLSTQPYQPYVYGFRIIKRHQDIFNNSKSLELDQNPTMSAFVHLTNVSLLDVLIHETFMELRSNCVVDKTFVLRK